MFDTRQPPSGVWRLVVLSVGQVIMLANMHVLLETLEPNPNGFRFDSPDKLLWFTVATLPPLLVGYATVTRVATVLVAAAQALSPLLLTGTMRDPNADLNFAIFLWWFPLPVLLALVAGGDRWLARRRHATRR